MEASLIWKAIERRQVELLRAARWTLRKRWTQGDRVAYFFTEEDLMQESILKVMRNPGQVNSLGDDDKGLLALFYLTMHHVLISWSRLRELSMTTPTDIDLLPPPISESTILSDMEIAERNQQLDVALSRLGTHAPTQELVLRYSMDIQKGESYITKAAEIGTSHTNFKQQMWNGVRSLRKELQP